MLEFVYIYVFFQFDCLKRGVAICSRDSRDFSIRPRGLLASWDISPNCLVFPSGRQGLKLAGVDVLYFLSCTEMKLLVEKVMPNI